MTPKDQILVGDHVSIFWENVQNIFDVEVLAVPAGPGEYWVLREASGQIHYVMSFSRMTKEKKTSREVPDEYLKI